MSVVSCLCMVHSRLTLRERLQEISLRMQRPRLCLLSLVDFVFCALPELLRSFRPHTSWGCTASARTLVNLGLWQ